MSEPGFQINISLSGLIRVKFPWMEIKYDRLLIERINPVDYPSRHCVGIKPEKTTATCGYGFMHKLYGGYRHLDDTGFRISKYKSRSFGEPIMIMLDRIYARTVYIS